MTECTYCSKTYTNKGIKRHMNCCKMKEKYYKELNKIKINFDEQKHNTVSLFSKIPNELLTLIQVFLPKRGEYETLKKHYNDILELSYVSKLFYKTFYPSLTVLNIMKTSLLEESQKYICKSTAKDIYQLTDDMLEYEIDHNLVKNPHYRSASPMKLYKITDILDYLYKNYKNKKNYYKFLIDEEERNRIEKIQRREERKVRLAEYNKLFKKYSIDKKDDLYIKYKDYVSDNYNKLTLIIIEEGIIKYNEENKRKDQSNNLIEKYDLNSIPVHYSFFNNYIYQNEYDFETLEEIIRDIVNRKNDIYQFLRNNNIKSEILYHIEKNLIDRYIIYNNYSPQEILTKINEYNYRRIQIKEEFENNNLNFQDFESTNEIYDYIYEKKGNLNKIVTEIIKYNFLNKYTVYNKISDQYNAEYRALTGFALRYDNYEECIKNLNLPEIFYNTIKDIFNKKELGEINKIIISCTNKPSPVCGYCKICCILPNCKRHSLHNNLNNNFYKIN